MHASRRIRPRSLCLLAAAVLLGCGTRVLVPPRVALGDYPSIGVVVFRSNASGNLPDYATQAFMQEVQAGQPSVRFLELGGESEVLGALDRTRLDLDALRALGQKWGVDAVFAGDLDVTRVTPRVRLQDLARSLSLQADVSATLHVRLVETHGGATVWTRSSRCAAPVAHVSLVSQGPIDFQARDPERAYGALVRDLVDQLAIDFRSRWVRQ